MPTDFWSGWIAVITLVSLVGLGWLLFSVYFSEDAEEAEGLVWDETLEEGSNPAPMWWFWLILATMVFSVIYLMLYPGLGSYKGALKWSQGHRLEQSVVDYAAEFGDIRDKIAQSSLESLRQDDAIMASAQRIFDRKCGLCHGRDAKGQVFRFPDLTDDEWQWGGSVAQIEESIRNGRQALMVGWQGTLSEADISQIAGYVQNFREIESPQDEKGRELYQQYCISCHGPTGEGNVMLGAPSMIDDVWLYGGSRKEIERSIASGRNGHMPAFNDRLDDTQIRMLLAWLTREQ